MPSRGGSGSCATIHYCPIRKPVISQTEPTELKVVLNVKPFLLFIKYILCPHSSLPFTSLFLPVSNHSNLLSVYFLYVFCKTHNDVLCAGAFISFILLIFWENSRFIWLCRKQYRKISCTFNLVSPMVTTWKDSTISHFDSVIYIGTYNMAL